MTLRLRTTAAARKQLEDALPEAQVIDFREGNPGLTRGLDNATSILSLICLVAMVLGAIGVAMALHAHLEQRMDMLAHASDDARMITGQVFPVDAGWVAS